MNNHKLLFGIGFMILSSVILSCGSKKKTNATTSSTQQQQQQAITADALIVSTQPLSADIEIPGTIMANETTEIHPEISF